MNATRKVGYILLTFAAIAILPWLGSWIRYNGVFPDNFFSFPPMAPSPIEPFSWAVFIGVGVVFVLIPACLYFFPAWFGFKKVAIEPTAEVPKVKLPLWFWVGLVLWSVTTVLFLANSTKPALLIRWCDLPLFWGFILMIDGWVYVRSAGKSLIARVPQEILAIAMVSMPGWMVYEYLNFFVEDYWYYPNAARMGSQEVLLYAMFTSATLMPLAFEWYCLFNTFPALKKRFSNGVKLVFPEWLKTTLLMLGLAMLVGTGLFPETMFVTLWISLPIVLAVALDKIGVWTPLRSIGKGNWTPTLLFALTYLLEGFLLEFQNFISGIHSSSVPDVAKTPLYWKYSIPYVDGFHIFELPVLGYAGYLPFGVYCWLWWIACAHLLNIPSLFHKEEPFSDVV